MLTLSSATPPALAQQPIPVRQIGAIEAASSETVGYLYGVRELSDGRVLVNDAGRRRLLLLDPTLQHAKLLADSGTATGNAYGTRPTEIIAYTGDSTLFVDVGARAFLVVDPSGRIVRVMSPPRPVDIPFLANPSFGTPGFDREGRILYRSMLMPAFHAPEPGKKFVPPTMADSAPILRGDFDRRATDTIAWVRTPKMTASTEYLAGGGVRMSLIINPMSTIDDWTRLPDGSIAILRGQDYHIDWINADGTRASSPKLPFDWRRLSDEEKAAIVDSTKKALEKQAAAGSLGTSQQPPGAGAPGLPMMSPHSMTILPAAGGDGAPPARTTVTPPAKVPDVVPPSELPDYVPPVVRSGTMTADPEGNVWILPSTSANSLGGLLYDVVNRRGELFQRVRLPEGRALEGFGANGAVYLTSHGPEGARVERARIR
jgi:hypothetical protein